ncbi:hypothetical protein V5735_19975 [Haladaptatus sp. SPP-AMP-3]|uniref:hypothetical protein n=1 Tax=Haladaptatus sp. SPP-AMP-3 TaxID=3121295 RepID=UPI003C2C3B16
MISRKARLRYIPYGLIVIGFIAMWYGYFERLPFLLIGVAAILGAGSVLVRGYTAANLAIMFGVMALSGFLGVIYAVGVSGASIWAIAYLAVGIAAGIRARQYWQARPWKPEDSGW